jgi:hypothetical protein
VLISSPDSFVLQYSVKFRVKPDVGVLVMRRFHYQKKEGEGTGWEVTQWSDDAEVPDYIDFDPDEHDEDDDMETFDEEEALAVNSREQDAEEEAELKTESTMSMAELLKKYYGIDAPEGEDEAPEPEPEPEPEEEEDDDAGEDGTRRRRRKRRRSSAIAADNKGYKEETAPKAKAAKITAEPDSGVSGGGSETVADAGGAGEARVGDGSGGAADAGNGGAAAAAAAAVGAGAAVGAAPTEYAIETPEDYFNPANHEEETEIVSGVAEKKSSRVGEQYQCIPLPSVGDPLAVPQATLVWSPPTAEEAAHFDAAAFTGEITAGLDYPTKPLEAALHALFANKYNGPETLNMRRGAALSDLVPWSQQEREAFEVGLLIKGKNFYMIHRDHVTTRSVLECVEFYYTWKWTDHYDVCDSLHLFLVC